MSSWDDREPPLTQHELRVVAKLLVRATVATQRALPPDPAGTMLAEFLIELGWRPPRHIRPGQKGGAASRAARQARQAVRRLFVRGVFERLPPALYATPGSATTLARVQEELQQIVQASPAIGFWLRASDRTIKEDIAKLGYRHGCAAQERHS